jgi:hypothetical protein
VDISDSDYDWMDGAPPAYWCHTCMRTVPVWEARTHKHDAPMRWSGLILKVYAIATLAGLVILAGLCYLLALFGSGA